MSETVILINRAEVSWQCWRYLCTKCKADAFKTDNLCLYVTRANPVTPADGPGDHEEAQP